RCRICARLSARSGRGVIDCTWVHCQQPAGRHPLRLAGSAHSLQRMIAQDAPLGGTGVVRGAQVVALPASPPRRLFVRRVLHSRAAAVGGGVAVLAVLVAVLAPLIAPYDPLKQDLGAALSGPSLTHLLGTDNNGRDVLARVIWGSRVSLIAGLVSV